MKETGGRMRSVLVSVVLLQCLAALAHGPEPDCGMLPCGPDAPRFAQYAVAQQVVRKPAPVDWHSHPRARRFRTALSQAVAGGPNFAGYYTVATWGCGVACLEMAIVDTHTGRVFFPGNMRRNAYHVVTEDRLPTPFQFVADSALLIVAGAPDDELEKGIFFYVWNGKTLRLRYKEAREWTP